MQRDERQYSSSAIKAKELVKLHANREKDEILDVQNISSPPQYLQRLFMYGRLERLPHWLQLKWSKLQLDPLESLRAFPNLQQLVFDDAYDGEELCVKAGGFQMLKELVLCRLGKLRHVTVQEGAIPHLQLVTKLHSITPNSDLSRVKNVPGVFIGSRDAEGLYTWKQFDKKEVNQITDWQGSEGIETEKLKVQYCCGQTRFYSDICWDYVAANSTGEVAPWTWSKLVYKGGYRGGSVYRSTGDQD
ncbi:hypothetical protein L484_000845 [Morus notabilis]|uniref:Uncharacterized protein n=1 Tax=Morus notabilis TaxID=981085 RepID=W9SHC9_9ROSA|nr:hypothetical protein L484_000845 [Morus notabilis]